LSSSEEAEKASDVADVHESAAESDAGPRKRRRRRRRGRAKGRRDDGSPLEPSTEASAESRASSGEQHEPPQPSLASLAGGLLSHIDDREVPCTVEGCDNTWTWTANEQIRSYGQPPPKRKCAECTAIDDREVPCAVESCNRRWVWSAEAQLKHRAWMRRQPSRDGNNKRRKGRAQEAPRRKCDLCHAKLLKIVERESVCKVHGCTRTVKIDKDSQLRAWAAMRTDDLDAEPVLPKKMCDVCREFCRTHPDRDVQCGRPGCDRTWTYKTGAQLQSFLAGRFEDPIRLACEGSDCDLIRAEAAHLAQLAALSGEGEEPRIEPDAEIMPCIVPGCERSWIWRPGMKVAPCNDGDQPVDRMCGAHRGELEGPPPASQDDRSAEVEVDEQILTNPPPR
jgi:hypothetical protein